MVYGPKNMAYKPPFMPYEPFLLGVGGGLTFVDGPPPVR